MEFPSDAKRVRRGGTNRPPARCETAEARDETAMRTNNMKSTKGTGVHELKPEEVDTTMDVSRANARPELDRAIQARIGDQLRAMYSELMQQPVPDRFAELIGKLEDGDAARKTDRSGEDSK